MSSRGSTRSTHSRRTLDQNGPGLLRSVHVEDVQPFAAGAERNAEAFFRDPAQRLVADPTVTHQVPYLAYALDLGVVAEHHVEYGGPAAPQARYLQDLHGRLRMCHATHVPII